MFACFHGVVNNECYLLHEYTNYCGFRYLAFRRVVALDCRIFPLMPFLSAQVAFATVHGYRMLWIPGTFGGGKTLLAMGMYAQYFLPRGYRLISNTQSIWTEKDLKKINLDVDGKLKVFILIDEGGQFFSDGDDIKELLRNPRKMDYVLCFPSFHPPHRTAQIFQIQPTWSFRSAGIPLINYDWYVKIGQYKNKGSFKWFLFQEMYGTYSSNNPGASPATIRKWLSAQNFLYRQGFGYDDEDDILDSQDGSSAASDWIAKVETDKSVIASRIAAEQIRLSRRTASDLDDTLALVEEETDEVSTLLARSSKRRKWR